MATPVKQIPEGQFRFRRYLDSNEIKQGVKPKQWSSILIDFIRNMETIYIGEQSIARVLASQILLDIDKKTFSLDIELGDDFSTEEIKKNFIKLWLKNICQAKDQQLDFVSLCKQFSLVDNRSVYVSYEANALHSDEVAKTCYRQCQQLLLGKIILPAELGNLSKPLDGNQIHEITSRWLNNKQEKESNSTIFDGLELIATDKKTINETLEAWIKPLVVEENISQLESCVFSWFKTFISVDKLQDILRQSLVGQMTGLSKAQKTTFFNKLNSILHQSAFIQLLPTIINLRVNKNYSMELRGHHHLDDKSGYSNKTEIIPTANGFFIREKFSFTGDATMVGHVIDYTAAGELDNANKRELMRGTSVFHFRFNPVSNKVEYRNTDLILNFRSQDLQDLVDERTTFERVKDDFKAGLEMNGLIPLKEIEQDSQRQIQDLKQERALMLRQQRQPNYGRLCYTGAFFSTIPMVFFHPTTQAQQLSLPNTMGLQAKLT